MQDLLPNSFVPSLSDVNARFSATHQSFSGFSSILFRIFKEKGGTHHRLDENKNKVDDGNKWDCKCMFVCDNPEQPIPFVTSRLGVLG